MRFFFLSYLLSYIFRNPLLILIIIFLLYWLLDQKMIGLMPDWSRWFKRGKRFRQLKQETLVNPANADAHLELGTILVEQRKYQMALESLEKAHVRMEDSARVQALIGRCLYHLGREDDAEKLLGQAVELNQKIRYGEPYYYLLAIKLKSDPENNEVHEELIRKILSWGSTDVYFRTGRVLLKAGKNVQASSMFKEAVENYQASPKGLRRLHRKWAFLAAFYLKISQ